MEELFSKPWSVRTNIWFYLRCGCFLELVGRRGRSYHLPEEQLLQAVEGPDDDKIVEDSSEGDTKGDVTQVDCSDVEHNDSAIQFKASNSEYYCAKQTYS